MRKCVLQSLQMLSIKEHKARRVDFHEKVTLIRGKNDTGKSSLLKTIYHTFSAEPQVLHPKWVDAEVRSVAHFSLSLKKYKLLRDGRKFTLFDNDNNVLMNSTSVTTGVSSFFANLFNFKLQLQSHTMGVTQASPAFMLLPFYIDQDMGWVKNWSSFTRLQQFSKWRKDVIEYHLGVRPNEFYEAKSSLSPLNDQISRLRQRRTVLDGVVLDLKKRLASGEFNLDLAAYQKDIEALLVVCNKMQKKEEELKERLESLYNNKAIIESQIQIATTAASELKLDYECAVEKLENEIECPTCGTTHKNSFTERFAIARDEMRCRELEAELQSELVSCDSEIAKLNHDYSAASVELAEARELLNRKQGDISLKEVIESEGRKEAHAVVAREIDQVNTEIGRIDAQILALQHKMASFDNPERRQTIRVAYLERMRHYLSDLAVANLDEKKYGKFDCNIPETGSDLPRALLAYYVAILHGIANNKFATFFPLVFDSPRQQDQDQQNWIRMLNFLKSSLPSDSQLILGLVENAGIEFEGTIIDLKRKYSVLSEDEYDSVASEMLPLIELASSRSRRQGK